jgi:arabinogalactan oligomer/maltooligosaccharide transport system substrate-binding protein
LAALAEQNQFASSQKDVLGSFWAPAEAFGTAMEAKDYSKSIKEQLDAMVAQIEG